MLVPEILQIIVYQRLLDAIFRKSSRPKEMVVPPVMNRADIVRGDLPVREGRVLHAWQCQDFLDGRGRLRARAAQLVIIEVPREE